MKQLLNNKVLSNASWIIGCKIVQMIINVIIGMVTARYLGPSDYGLINYAASIVAFMIPIMQLGLNSVLVQELVNEPKKEGETLGTAIVLSVCSSFLCIIGIVAFSTIMNTNETNTIIVCSLYSIVLIFRAFELIIYWFQAKLLSKYTSIMMLVAYGSVAIYKVFLLITAKNIYWFAISQAIDFAIIAFGCIAIYMKLGGQKLFFSRHTAKKLLSKSCYYILSGMMVTIFAQMDRVMIKIILNNEETGYYSAALTTAALSSFVFTAIVDSFRPTIFNCQKKSIRQFEDRLSLLYSIVIYISLIQCTIMTIFSRFIIFILFGKQFGSSVNVLRIGVWYTTFAYLGMVRDIWIVAENKHKYLWRINLLGVLANFILNYFLIQLWGINGAALASLLTQFFTNVIVGFIIKPIRRNNTIMLKGMNPSLLIDFIKSNLMS